MLQLAKQRESRFRSLREVNAHLTTRQYEAFETDLGSIGITNEGMVEVDDVVAPVTQSAFAGLVAALGMNWRYAVRTCPHELLIDSLRELTRRRGRRRIRVQITNGVITAVMSHQQLPLSHESLIGWLGIDRPIHEAILYEGTLRITTAPSSPLLVEDSPLKLGWEILNDETGWQPTQLWHYAFTEEPANGYLGFRELPAINREARPTESICRCLEDLVMLVNSVSPADGLTTAWQEAAAQRLGSTREALVERLAHRLERRTTKLLLRDLTEGDSLVTVATVLSSAARNYRLPMRRKYEAEAGSLLFCWRRVHTSPKDCASQLSRNPPLDESQSDPFVLGKSDDAHETVCECKKMP